MLIPGSLIKKNKKKKKNNNSKKLRTFHYVPSFFLGLELSLPGAAIIIIFVATKTCLSRQNTSFVATKIILVADPANDLELHNVEQPLSAAYKSMYVFQIIIETCCQSPYLILTCGLN